MARNAMSKKEASKSNAQYPKIVSARVWQAAHDKLLRKEKAATHARDALAAERRRLPMVRIDKDYVFDGEAGPASLLDLFEGRSQLILYHFMFAPGVHGWPSAGCPGCSMFTDNVGHFALVYLHFRDTSFVLVSRAPIENIRRYKERMGWTLPLAGVNYFFRRIAAPDWLLMGGRCLTVIVTGSNKCGGRDGNETQWIGTSGAHCGGSRSVFDERAFCEADDFARVCRDHGLSPKVGAPDLERRRLRQQIHNGTTAASTLR
jgi:hypothetical protein